jgi:hypothetical protein
MMFFQLLGDAVGDQLGINFRLANFFDVDGDRHAQLWLFLEGFNVLVFADHNTGRAEKIVCGILGGRQSERAKPHPFSFF